MKGTRASKSFAAVSLALATMVPAIQASASTVQFKTKTITIGNYSVNASGFVAKDSGTPTTYMPLWYVLHGLGHLGFATKWNGATKTLNITAPVWVTPKAAGNPGSGSASIYLNGVLVQRANLQVATDPASHVSSVYMPIYYVARVMNLVGISSAWNGTTWKLGLADPTGPNPMYTTYQIVAGDRGSNTTIWDVTLRDANGNLVAGKTISDFTASINGGAQEPLSSYPFNGFKTIGTGVYEFNYQSPAGSPVEKMTIFSDGTPVVEQAFFSVPDGDPSPDLSQVGFIPGPAGSKQVKLHLYLNSAQRFRTVGVAASDITVSIDGGSPLPVTAAPFSDFTVNKDNTYEFTYTGTGDGETHHFDIYFDKQKVYSNVEVYTPGASGQLDWYHSKLASVTSGSAGSHVAILIFQLEDANGNPITGKTANDFQVSINGGATTTLASSPFSDFKDFQNGTYGVAFLGKTDSEHDLLNVTVDGLLIANQQDLYTASAVGEPDYWGSSTVHVTPGPRGSKSTTLQILLKDANGDPVNGKTAGDFVVSVNNGPTATFNDSRFSNFKALSNGLYEVTYTGTASDAYDLLDISVDGIEVGGRVLLPTGNVDAVMSGVWYEQQSAGSGKVQLMFAVDDDQNHGITGLTAKDFSFSVNGAASVTPDRGAFAGFKEIGNGLYTVTFTGDPQSDYQMNITAGGLTIDKQYDVFTP